MTSKIDVGKDGSKGDLVSKSLSSYYKVGLAKDLKAKTGKDVGSVTITSAPSVSTAGSSVVGASSSSQGTQAWVIVVIVVCCVVGLIIITGIVYFVVAGNKKTPSTDGTSMHKDQQNNEHLDPPTMGQSAVTGTASTGKELPIDPVLHPI